MGGHEKDGEMIWGPFNWRGKGGQPINRRETMGDHEKGGGKLGGQ